jgi:ABC-2 type transport system ATP-binding protein
MITVERLSKTFGDVVAVDDVSFACAPGRVTGFLGPNGAGKTTTLRMLLGLVRPTSGASYVDGRRFADLDDPIRTVGAALEASSFHPGRSGRTHLRWLAEAGNVPADRVPQVLELVGLTDTAGRRVGTYSMGMRQRLALAGALLGDPRVLVLDEPANGLDPEGIAWLRGFLRYLAGEGRTVLLSSHVLAEVQQTVDDVVIVARGRLVLACPLAELDARAGRTVVVRSPDVGALHSMLEQGVDGQRPTSLHPTTDGGLVVAGVPASLVGRAALRAGAELHELREEGGDLERVFLELTRDPAAPDAAGSVP